MSTGGAPTVAGSCDSRLQDHREVQDCGGGEAGVPEKPESVMVNNGWHITSYVIVTVDNDW